MHIALSLVLRVIIALAVSIAVYYHFGLTVSWIVNIGQCVFFFSLAAFQPDWATLLGVNYLRTAEMKIDESDKKVSCVHVNANNPCFPQINDKHKNAIEIAFCMRRVESRALRLEEDTWRMMIPYALITLVSIIISITVDTSSTSNGSGRLQSIQPLEIVLPVLLFCYSFAYMYGEILCYRQISRAAANL